MSKTVKTVSELKIKPKITRSTCPKATKVIEKPNNGDIILDDTILI